MGVAGQESVNELDNNDAPDPAESLVPAVLVNTFIDCATFNGPDVVSAVAVGAGGGVTIGVMIALSITPRKSAT